MTKLDGDRDRPPDGWRDVSILGAIDDVVNDAAERLRRVAAEPA